MKPSRSDVRCKARSIPELRFENQTLTSFAGLVVFLPFFANIHLKACLGECFRHLRIGKVFSRATIFLQLIVHILLGYRELRDGRYYRDDPIVRRLLGLKRLPDVATIKRSALWVFEKLETFRRTLIQRAGRLTRPQGVLTLTISAADTVKNRLLQILADLPAAA